MAAIAAGLCNVAVIAYGSTQRSVGRKQASVREINPYETPFKPFLPSIAYAHGGARATCTSSAPRASRWRRSRSRRANGRSSTRRPGRRSR